MLTVETLAEQSIIVKGQIFFTHLPITGVTGALPIAYALQIYCPHRPQRLFIIEEDLLLTDLKVGQSD